MKTALRLSSERRTRLSRVALAAAGLLALLAVPVLLTTSSLRFAINAGGLYEYGFDEYNISRRTGIEGPELSRIAREIRDYFNSGDEYIDIQATIYGEETDLFKQREIIHMRDVKSLIQRVYLLQWIALGYLVGYGAYYGLRLKRASLPALAKKLIWGGGLTLALILALGLGSLVGFDALFLKFHQLGFSNDFWQLDPRIHNLIAMFPQHFFLDATIFVALMTIGQALLLVAAGGGYLWWRRRTRRRAPARTAAKLSGLGPQTSTP